MKVTVPDIVVSIFKNILEENTDKPQNIRIYFSGIGCGGPSFCLTLDEKADSDLEYCINELHFIMDTIEFNKYGNMIIEDAGFDLIVRPQNIQKTSDCYDSNYCNLK